MSLRARLVASMTVLLLVVIAAVGVAATRSVRGILVDQVDGSLVTVASRRGFPKPGTEPHTETVFFRSIAEIHMTSSGTLVLSRPSGFTDDPDELPDLGSLPLEEGFSYVGSVDGSVRYRTFLDVRPDRSVSVYAIPMATVDQAIATLINRMLAAGALVLLAGGAATWWAVSRAMRPVDEMIEVAAAIAGGDLSRRVPELDTATELGRLSTALNQMLVNIEGVMTSELEARERLRQFIADASHELRTPLTTVIGYAELRSRGGLDDPEVESQAWERIESESRRMARITEDLLTLARLGQSQELQRTEVDLVEVARGLVEDHRAVDTDRTIELDAPDDLIINGDPGRLHQVLGNLLSNARVHTPPGTRIVIRLSAGPRGATVVVADTGPGIPPEALDAVFDRFYRTDKSRARKSGGSGLGLAIVRAIVEAHGGTVSVENAPHGGAQFTVNLPDE